MEDYHNLLNNRITELYSIVNKLNDSSILPISKEIQLRKEYIIIADSYLDILKLIEKKIQYGKERCEKHINQLNHT